MFTALRRTAAAVGIFSAVFLTAWAALAAPLAPWAFGPATPFSQRDVDLVDVLPMPASPREPRSAPGSLHTPMTRPVVERLRAVLAASPGRKDVFIKVGDSNTVNSAFLSCFAGDDVRLGDHGALAPTLAWFGARAVDGRRTSFDRVTAAGRVGWLAGNVLAGDPSPLEREITALRPAFAVIMLGTNDNRPGGVATFAERLGALVDHTLALGVVPLLSTIPPRADSPAAAARVAELNGHVHAIAEARQVPLMDLHAALVALRGQGLASDGVHLQVAGAKAPHGCWLTPEAVGRGMNTRNLVTLTALDRARRFLIEGEAPEA